MCDARRGSFVCVADGLRALNRPIVETRWGRISGRSEKFVCAWELPMKFVRPGSRPCVLGKAPRNLLTPYRTQKRKGPAPCGALRSASSEERGRRRGGLDNHYGRHARRPGL